ncbi:putative N-acetyltransferase YjaB [Gimesia panareensis]|uniref:Putative N-acetyltransferase YjaB n=1 Tax=Gimesia panareensis TaxID=2527978 RepID=A0A518FIP6_9PLAN|nr:GNAT family N-acetyltransferase [Gimesia panareensis]QDV16222.1 putative N-acetyltransferase YjaB [Gimesia panareensis]
MIRRFTDNDITEVGQIWLEASLIAHDFVSADFWQADHEVMVSELLPGANGYVHETEGTIDGFVLVAPQQRSNYMGALFVSPQRQGRGIGTQLLDHIKALRGSLTTSVYKQNQRTVEFYKSRDFQVVGESVCEHTGCEEYELEWTGNPDQPRVS